MNEKTIETIERLFEQKINTYKSMAKKGMKSMVKYAERLEEEREDFRKSIKAVKK